MKAFKIVLKILAALAAVVGVVYVVATYGGEIVAWAKNLLEKCKEKMGLCDCCCCDEDCCCCDEDCCCDEEDCCCEEGGCCCSEAEEAPTEETPVEEPANEADFEN